MNELMLARTQRVLDQLPRPPSELPPGHPMRMLHEALENAYEARDFAEDVEKQSEEAWSQKEQVDDEIAELNNTMDEMKDDLTELRGERKLIETALVARGIELDALLDAA